MSLRYTMYYWVRNSKRAKTHMRFTGTKMSLCGIDFSSPTKLLAPIDGYVRADRVCKSCHAVYLLEDLRK